MATLRFSVLALSGIVLVGCADRRTASATDADQTSAMTASTTPSPSATTTATTPPADEKLEPTGRVNNEATVVLDEEKMNVQKRSVSAGGVVISKDVETREVSQPVELRSETVEVERLTPEEAQKRNLSAQGAGRIDEKGEVFIPLQREVAVVQKEVQPREVVRAETSTAVQEKEVGTTLRREVANVERQAGTPTSSMQPQQLEQRIRTELRSASDLGIQGQQLEQINVRVEANTVILSGNVPSQEAAQTIEQRVRQMDGVQEVRNELRAR